MFLPAKAGKSSQIAGSRFGFRLCWRLFGGQGGRKVAAGAALRPAGRKIEPPLLSRPSPEVGCLHERHADSHMARIAAAMIVQLGRTDAALAGRSATEA